MFYSTYFELMELGRRASFYVQNEFNFELGNVLSSGFMSGQRKNTFNMY